MTNSRRASFAGALVLATWGLFLGSDVSAAQEIKVLSPEIHTYRSPLVLEFPLAEAFEKGVWYTTALSAHSCRGFTIERIEIKVVVLDHEKFLTLKTTMVMNNNSGKDKQATVDFEILKDDDEKAVTSTTLKKAKVGAGDTELKEIKIPVPPELMPVGFKMSGPNKDVLKHAIRLRLALTVVDY